jgi:hypothetical protein
VANQRACFTLNSDELSGCFLIKKFIKYYFIYMNWDAENTILFFSHNLELTFLS